MIKDNQKHFNRLHVLIDALVFIIAYALAFYIRFISGLIPPVENFAGPEYQKYAVLLLFIVPIYLILCALFNLYTPKRVAGRKTEIINIIVVNALGVVTIIVGLYLLELMHYSRATLGIFAFLSTVIQIFVRTMIKNFLYLIRPKGKNVKYVLLVGYSRAAEEYIKRIQDGDMLAEESWMIKLQQVLYIRELK